MNTYNNTKTILLIVFIASISFSLNAVAGFRCKNGSLVNKGDLTFEVIKKCGNPTDKQYFGQVEVDEQNVNLERWTYIPEKGRLIKYLDFHNGVVKEISTGSRVK